MYEDATTEELQRLRDKFLAQLTATESSWRGWYYVAGLLAAMGAVYLALRDGIDGFHILLVLFGLPAVWLWSRDSNQRQSVERAYKAVTDELAKRGDLQR